MLMLRIMSKKKTSSFTFVETRALFFSLTKVIKNMQKHPTLSDRKSEDELSLFHNSMGTVQYQYSINEKQIKQKQIKEKEGEKKWYKALKTKQGSKFKMIGALKLQFHEVTALTLNFNEIASDNLN